MTDDFVRIELPEPHYTLLKGEQDGLPDIFCINDSLVSFAHTDIFAWHLKVTINAKELAENGMPTPDESALLFEFGDRFEQALVGENALFLARSTWNGLRTLYYQVYDPDVANEVLQVMLAEEPQVRTWDFAMHHDPEWVEASQMFSQLARASGSVV